MPPTATPKATPKNAPKKIPTWGWIVGGILGILIGYFVLRSSPASAANALSPSDGSGGSTPTDSTATPTGEIPWEEILKALGLRSGGSTEPQRTVPESTSQNNAEQAASDPGPQSVASTSTDPTFTAFQTDSPVYGAIIDQGSDVVNPVYTPAYTAPDNPSSSLAYAPGPSGGAMVGTTGTITGWDTSTPNNPGVQAVNVDPSGHVVSPKGTRVGGFTGDDG